MQFHLCSRNCDVCNENNFESLWTHKHNLKTMNGYLK